MLLQSFGRGFRYRNKLCEPCLNAPEYRYIDDLVSFNNKRFREFISHIYPKELAISETTEFTSVASYLDLLFTWDENNNITIKLDDKPDAFGFHIV